MNNYIAYYTVVLKGDMLPGAHEEKNPIFSWAPVATSFFIPLDLQ